MNPKSNCTPEQINLTMMIILFVLTIVAFILEKSPSIYKQIFGQNTPPQESFGLSIPCLVFLIIVMIGSALWITYLRKEINIWDKLTSVLDEYFDEK